MNQEKENKIKELQMKNQKVAEGAMKINTQIEHAKETTAKLKEAAQKKFGESDLEKVKAMAALWEKENDENERRYENETNILEAEVQSKNALMKQIQQNQQN